MKKLKDILKKNPEPAKAANVDAGQLGQYSAKHQVNEGALEQYLSSRGIDHEHLSTATKIAYSKSAVFLKWKRDHMMEDRTTELSPTHKRLHKIRKSVAAHQVIKTEQAEMDEAKISMSSVGHSEFKPGQIAHHQYLGKVEVADKTGKKVYSLKDKKYYDVGHGTLSHKPIEEAKKPKPTALERFRAAAAERAKKHAETEKNSGGMSSAIDRLAKHLNKEEMELDEMSKANPKHPMHQSDSSLYKKTPKSITKNYATHAGKYFSNKDTIDFTLDYKKTDKEAPRYKNEEVEQIDELKKSTLASYKDKSMASLTNAQANRDAAEYGKHMSKGFADLHAKSDAIAKKRVKGLIGYMQRKQGMKPTSEDVGDPLAATQSPADGANGGKEISERKRQMSKSARMIKALYKKKGMVKEDLYDHEKEDKSVATYGKKPKFDKAEKDEGGEKKPEAAAVLTGGTTLTGEKRDDIEIDPLMRNRPGQPDVTKKDDKDKKKDGKKEEKK
jgi:hypothetical protein